MPEIENLAGAHELRGFDRWTEETLLGSDREVCLIDLDGVVFRLREKPFDGKRCHESPKRLVLAKVRNRFPRPVRVICEHFTAVAHPWDKSGDVLRVRNVAGDGAIALEVGTTAIDTLYPSWICNYRPEALTILAPPIDSARSETSVVWPQFGVQSQANIVAKHWESEEN